ncbi:DUF805 domain-containing protein [Bacillus tuaregi]|uniref:DUF805 domain-containing protein n=1 Tax=Bacillus tuaregi TaxID=1816695 RepID=UPI0008F97452|nr:DUF805 domain-containing protein [Bacillus tuaregi]
MEWYFKVIQDYLGFHGRASRKEFWMFTLINFIIVLILSAVERLAGIETLLTLLYGLVIFLPSLAVSVRRLHDTGRSGWWFLISLIPFIGIIVLIVFLCMDSDSYENLYGPKPEPTLGQLAGHL